MEFPFGHHHHDHHGHRRDDDESGDFPRPPPPNPSPYPPPQPHYDGSYPPSEYPPPPPPPSYGGAYHQPPPEYYPPHPPPPQVAGVYHSAHHTNNNPPLETQNYPPSGSASYVHHSAHEEGPHHFQPHMPAFIEGHFHSPDLKNYLSKKPIFRVYCKAGRNQFAVAIRDGKVVMARSDPSDPTQNWIKDEKYSTKVKDEEGYPSFALVNRATGQAVKHSIDGHPVQLTPYKPDVFDESILWTESKDLGGGYRTIRMVNNIRMCMDAFHGNDEGVHDGTIVALYGCWKGDNQQWKITTHS